MKISIILGAYNGERYIGEQIDSILANSYTKWSLTVWDDGSVDGTKNIVREYEKKYPGKIRLYENTENQGVVLNFLSAAMENEADYVMFCDQDDIWLPEKIKHTLGRMGSLEKQYGASIPLCVFSDARVVDSHLNILEESFFASNRLNVRNIDLSHMLMENKLLGCTVMFNKALSDKLKVLPGNVKMHDWWIGLIAAAFGHIGYLKESTMLYRQHGDNVIGNQTFRTYFKNRITSLKKQRRALIKNQLQAETFYTLYREELSEAAAKTVREFAFLHEEGWLVRRYRVIRCGYWKTGISRNAGVLLLI